MVLSILYQQQMLGKNPQFVIVIYSLPLIVFSFLKLKRHVSKSVYLYMLFITSIIIFISLNSFIVRNEMLSGAFLSLLITSAVSYIIVNKKIHYPSIYLLPFIFFVTFILYRISIVILPELVFINSRNYISYVLIISIVPYYFLVFISNTKQNISFIPAVLTFILSAYSLGRSGTFASFLILGALLVYWSKGSQLKKLIALFVTVIFITMFVSFLVALNSENELSRFQNLSDGGRANILNEIIETNKTYNYILGFDPKMLSSYSNYGHLHSSILNMFSVIGIMIYVYLVGLIIFFYKLYKKGNIALILIYVSLIARLSTDVGVGFGFMDYVLWLPIAYLAIR